MLRINVINLIAHSVSAARENRPSASSALCKPQTRYNLTIKHS